VAREQFRVRLEMLDPAAHRIRLSRGLGKNRKNGGGEKDLRGNHGVGRLDLH
jgi:hypothetical protein